MEMEQAHTTVNEAERALHSATERLAKAAHQAVDTLSVYGGQAEERVRESGAVASERSREFVDQVKRYVEDHPMAAIGIAAAVGFGIGMMLRHNGSAERPAAERQ